MPPQHCQSHSGCGFVWSCASEGLMSFGKLSSSAIFNLSMRRRVYHCSSPPPTPQAYVGLESVCENIILGLLSLLSSAYFPSCIFHNVAQRFLIQQLKQSVHQLSLPCDPLYTQLLILALKVQIKKKKSLGLKYVLISVGIKRRGKDIDQISIASTQRTPISPKISHLIYSSVKALKLHPLQLFHTHNPTFSTSSTFISFPSKYISMLNPPNTTVCYTSLR